MQKSSKTCRERNLPFCFTSFKDKNFFTHENKCKEKIISMLKKYMVIVCFFSVSDPGFCLKLSFAFCSCVLKAR